MIVLCFGIGMSTSLWIFTLCTRFLEAMVDISIFLGCSFYLLSSKKFFLEKVIEILPTTDREDYQKIITRYVNGVFLSSFSTFVVHVVVTLLLFWILEEETFVSSIAFLSGISG